MKKIILLTFAAAAFFLFFTFGCNKSAPATPYDVNATLTAIIINPTLTHVASLWTPTFTSTITQTATVTLTPTFTSTATVTATTCTGSGLNFGNSGSVLSGYAAGYLQASRYTNSNQVQLTGFSVFVQTISGVTLNGNCIAAIYTDNSGTPGSLIAQSPQTACTSGWNTLNLSLPVNLAPGTYWLAEISDTDSVICSSAGGTGYYTLDPITFGTLPSTFAANGVCSQDSFSMLIEAICACPN